MTTSSLAGSPTSTSTRSSTSGPPYALATTARGIRSALPLEDEDGDLPVGPGRIDGVVRPRLDRPGPPLLPLLTRELAGQVVVALGSVLQLDMRIGDQVVVPDRVLRRSALRGDDRVVAVVLDAHEGGLAHLAGLRSTRRQDDDGPAVPRRPLRATRALVELNLVAHPLLGARLVFTLDRHSPSQHPAPVTRVLRLQPGAAVGSPSAREVNELRPVGRPAVARSRADEHRRAVRLLVGDRTGDACEPRAAVEQLAR